MFAYILDENTKQLAIFPNGKPSEDLYHILDIQEYEVEQGYDGSYYVKGYAPQLSIEHIKETKLYEINVAYNEATSTLVASYPQNELLTFDKQEAEARAWIADNAVETPLVDMLAAGRQMDKAELVNRIIAKADAFALAVGYLTGQRQRYEDMLDAAKTAEEVEAINPVYSSKE